MIDLRSMDCCAVFEISRIQDRTFKSKEFLKYLLCALKAEDRFYPEEDFWCHRSEEPKDYNVPPLFIFTTNGRRGSKNALDIIKIIKQSKLGSVKVIKPVLNRNSGNKVTTYVWRANVPNLVRVLIKLDEV